MNWIVFFIHILILSIYALLVSALLWHYKKYSLPKDQARWVIRSFVIIVAILAVLSTSILFAVPWDSIKIANFISL